MQIADSEIAIMIADDELILHPNEGLFYYKKVLHRDSYLMQTAMHLANERMKAY